MMDNKMTAEQAIKKLLRLLWQATHKRPDKGEVSKMIDLAYATKEALSAPRVPEPRKANHADYGYTVSHDKPWFFYDPEGDGVVFTATEAEARAGAEEAIANSLDDFWSDCVDQICYGRVMQAATQVDREERPESLDEEGCTEDGEHWPEDCEFKCNFKLLPLAASPEPVAHDSVCAACGKRSIETGNNGPIVVCPACRYDDPTAPATAQHGQQIIDDLRAEVEALKACVAELEEQWAVVFDGHAVMQRMESDGQYAHPPLICATLDAVAKIGKERAARLREGGK